MLHQPARSCVKFLFVGFFLVLATVTPGKTQQIQDNTQNQSIELTLGQALGLAQQQLSTNPQAAESIAQAVVAGVPGHFDALMLLATARMAQGKFRGAASAAKKAFASGPKGPARRNAARLASSAHFRAGQFTRAEWWLRRALNNATSDADRQVLSGDFNIVRRANPFSAQLSFSLAPNSNINNGTNSDTVLLFGAFLFTNNLNSKPLAGFEASVSANLKYRLSESQNHKTEVGLTLFSRTFELAASTQEALEQEAAANGGTVTVKGSDYAFSVAEISLKHIQIFEKFPGPSSIALNLGKNWYGGEEYTRYSRLTLTQDFGLSDRTNLQLSLSGNHQINIRDGGTPSDTYIFGSSLSHRLAGGDQIGLSISLQETQSSVDPTVENTSVSAQISYQFARPVLGMALSGHISNANANFPTSLYGPTALSKRHDHTIGLGLTAVFVNMDFLGFSPSMTLEASKTDSSINFFDRESLGMRFGIQSTF